MIFKRKTQRIPATPWEPGDAFARLTGKSVAECKTIDDIDAAVARALKMKGPLPFDKGTGAGFVVPSGDVFPHAQDTEEALAQRIDAALAQS